MKDFASAIRQQLPNCPPDDAVQVARRACERGSGRVGRTEAGRELSDDAVTLAVRVHIRHAYTPYDDYLMDGWDRSRARDAVVDSVDRIMRRWAG